MIRALTEHDLSAVADLYQRIVRGGGPPPEWLAPYFRQTVLDHPWYDSDLPSLVHEESDGSLSAFIGVHVRRLQFEGRPIRLACSGQLVADPVVGGASGLMLMRAFLSGPQDISITDGATPAARAMWTRLGGKVRELESISWVAVLRPVRAGAGLLASRAPLIPVRSGGGRLVRALDTRWRHLIQRSAAGAPRSTPLDTETLVSVLPTLTSERRLAPTYDERFARWLLWTLEQSVARGELRVRLVSNRKARPAGLFVYYRLAGGCSQVICLVGRPDSLGTVIGALFADALQGGASSIAGRLEPQVADALAGRRFVLRHTGEALVHARDAELGRSILAGDAWLTRLEGEYWMAHHLERP